MLISEGVSASAAYCTICIWMELFSYTWEMSVRLKSELVNLAKRYFQYFSWKKAIVWRQELHMPLPKPTLSEDFLGVFLVDISGSLFVRNTLQSLRARESECGNQMMYHSAAQLCSRLFFFPDLVLFKYWFDKYKLRVRVSLSFFLFLFNEQQIKHSKMLLSVHSPLICPLVG